METPHRQIQINFLRVYGFDPWGNITNFAGVTLNYATSGNGAPSTNRINTDSQSFSYSYDAAGNMTAGMGQSFAYDGANRLKTAGNGNSSFGYDGDGNRVKKIESSSTVYYVYSSKLGQSVMEVTANSILRTYVYGGRNKLVAMQAADGQFYWLHTNHLGNARTMTDANGNVAYGGQFDPYGQTLAEWSASGNANLNNRKFTGYERDATELDYAQARMYQSARGRFIQSDPAGQKAVNPNIPQSLNRYSYAQGDPVNFIDPGGTCLFPVWVQVTERYGYWETDRLCAITENEPRGQRKKPPCKPKFDKQLTVAAYMLAAGLDGEDAESSPISTFSSSNSGEGFLMTFKDAEMEKVLKILKDSGLFLGGTWGGQDHTRELKDKFGDLGDNALFLDFRSITTLTSDKALGERSLQITLYFDKNNKDKIIGAYADTDAENFREGAGPLLAHGAKYIGGKFAEWFGRRCE